MSDHLTEGGRGYSVPLSPDSFDPGYPLGGSLAGVKQSDLPKGYTEDGKQTGEGRR